MLRFPIITALLISTLLAGCSNKTVLVYEPKGDKQCQGGGLSLEDSKAKLLKANIQVHHSECGKKTGISVITVCGGPTTSIIIHMIEESDKNIASGLGFKDVSSLINAERGASYETTNC